MWRPTCHHPRALQSGLCNGRDVHETSASQMSEFIEFPRSELERSIVSRFEQVVASAAHRVAVRSGTCELTYDALNQAANSVAHAVLQLRGSVAEPVGLLLEPDEQTVASILGVLKAGKFYVPLDPSNPSDRLSVVLEDCRPSVLITATKYLGVARQLAPNGCAVVPFDDSQDGSLRENPNLAISPDALASVFYTSGSTGRPKGVMQTHRLVLHRVMVDTNRLRICAEDRLSLLTSPSYSVSVRHLFGALLNGAAVCPFDLVDRGLAELATWLRREEISIYYSAPAVFREFAGSLSGGEQFGSVRVLHLGGEPVVSGDFDQYKRHFPSRCAFINSLASNETGILTMYVAERSARFGDGGVPVGYQADDKQILILDDEGREAGANQLGQVAVRSRFLSPGYWGQSKMTAAAFRPDPDRPGTRVFSTGDLGMMLPDGCLVYKGRRDFRAKVHGIRVEVEEIEAGLRVHPSVDQVVVVARADQPGEHRLIAYVVPKREALITVSDLRAFLSETLPAYMIPSAFVFLDALPLTVRGKVDRQALPTPSHARPVLRAEFAAPRDQLERDLAQLCESILGIRPIGAEDNLLDLGLDSLTILRLVAQIEDRLGKHFPPARLFGSPTVAQLASLLRDSECSDSWSSLVPVHPSGTKPAFFWIHLGFGAPSLSRYLGPDQPFYVLEHQSQDGKPAVYTDVETIAAYYLREIRKVQPHGPYLLGGYSFGGVVALELAQQVRRQGEEVRLLALLDPPSLVKHGRSSPALSIQKEWTTSSVRDELNRHLGNLAPLTLTERLSYVGLRAVDRASAALRIAKAKRSAEALICKVYLALGCRLPLFVRSAYILEIYGRARSRYLLQPYRGRVVFFKGQSRTYQPRSDWGELIDGDCEVHAVSGEHQHMVKEPDIYFWAARLKAVLAEAQDNMPALAGAHARHAVVRTGD